MNIAPTGFADLFILEYKSFKDNRGEFVKTIHDETYAQAGLEYKFTESFYSVSKKGVIRGMHFQTPPHHHVKVVYVLVGKIIDVVLDLRHDSETYGKFFSAELSEENRKGIYIGKGFAHGFITLEENSIVKYHTTTSQNKEHEGGIKWDSFGFDWNIQEPIISERDMKFDGFNSSNRYF